MSARVAVILAGSVALGAVPLVMLFDAQPVLRGREPIGFNAEIRPILSEHCFQLPTPPPPTPTLPPCKRAYSNDRVGVLPLIGLLCRGGLRPPSFRKHRASPQIRVFFS